MDSTRTIVPIRNEEDDKAFGFDIRAAPEHLDEVTKEEFLLETAHVDPKSFMFLNKPPDVRMNGDFDITVERVILAWNPSLTKDQLKWVHRLDFATSGVLCVGLSKEAAKVASEEFQARKTKKEYIAVVEGVLDPMKWPIASMEDLSSSLSSSPSSSSSGWKRRLAVDMESIAVDGYATPPPSWQQQAMETSLNEQWKALEDLNVRLENQDKNIMETISLGKEYHSTNKKARKTLRKLLKMHKIELNTPRSEMNEYTEAAEAVAAYKKKCKEKYFEILQATNWADHENESPPQRIYRRSDSSSERIVIVVPIHQSSDKFLVEVGGQTSKPGRYSETEVEVLAYGTYMGKPVTKVRLHPVTGRRHQLRLHMKIIGHAIVGDASYNAMYTSASHRMMLHAHRLSIDLSSFCLPASACDEAEDSSTVTIEAVDPFILNDQGEIKPMLPSYASKRESRTCL